MSERTRAYLYRVSGPALALLAFYGVLSETALPLWSAFLAAALSGAPSVLAARHTSTER